MAGIRVEGNTSGNVAEVDANNNLKTTLPLVLSQAGYAVLVSENDAGTVTGTPLRRTPDTTPDFRLTTGRDTPLFDHDFNAGAQDTGVWKCAFSTMTMTESSGTLLLNANSDVTSAHSCGLQSWRYFDLMGNGGLRVEFVAQITVAALANQIIEFGMFTVAATPAVPTDGVYFRYTSAGLIGCVNSNGTETTTGTLLASLTPATMYDFQLKINERTVEFWHDDIMLGSIATPAANAAPFVTGALPICVQFRNASTVSGSPVMQFKVGACHVDAKDTDLGLPASHQRAGMGLTQQGTNGGTQGSLSLYTNNLAPGTGVAMTNTTAALGVGLGGQFAALPTLASGTDGIVSSFQNPLGSVTQKPRTLMITGVRVQSLVTTALTGGPLYYVYTLAFGGTALSLATAESGSFANGTAKARRIVPIGIEAIVVTAPVGTLGSVAGQYMAFNSPIPVNPGEYVQVCAKNVGTVTSAGVVLFLVSFDAYWI